MRQLEYLVAVADEGHIGRAAARCFVAQPSLSEQLKQLETQLGAAVTERVGRGIRLTAVGAELAERARAILLAADDLSDVAGQAHSELVGRVALAAIPTVAPYLIPRVLPTIRRRHPRVELRLEERQTRDLVPALVRGQVDLGLLALPILEEGLDWVEVLDDPFLLALDPAHAMADAADVTVEGLAGEDVLLLEDGHCLRDQALEICHSVGVQEPGAIQATSLPTLCQMVAAGMGVTLLPESARPVEARAGAGLVVRRFGGDPPSRRIVLAWRASSPSSPLYRDLAEAIDDALE